MITAGDDFGCHIWSIFDLMKSKTMLPTSSRSSSIHPLRSFDGHSLPIVDLAVRSFLLVTVSLDGFIKGWHIGSGAVLFSAALPSPATSVTIDPTERFTAVGMTSGQVATVDLQRGEILNVFHVGNEETVVTAVALSPTATELLAGTDQGIVSILDLKTGVTVSSVSQPKKKKKEDGLLSSSRSPSSSQTTDEKTLLPSLSLKLSCFLYLYTFSSPNTLFEAFFSVPLLVSVFFWFCLRFWLLTVSLLPSFS